MARLTKGRFLTSGYQPDTAVVFGPRNSDKVLSRRYPEMAETIRAAGPSLEEIEARQAARLAEIKARVDAAQARLETMRAIAAKRRGK
jgi:hypothetical protein